MVAPDRGAVLRPLRFWNGTLLRNPRVRQRHVDRHGQRRPPACEYGKRTDRYLLARSRRDWIVCRHRRRIRCLRSGGGCRDVQGEGNIDIAEEVTVTIKSEGERS